MNLKTPSAALRTVASKVYRARIRHLPLTPFDRAFQAVESFAMVGPRHLSRLYRGVHDVVRRGVPGHIVECGCARGGSAAMLGFALRDLGPELSAGRNVWLYDTFEGLPEPSPGDPDYDLAMKAVGTCRGDLESVKGLMRTFALSDKMMFVKGLYDDTLPGATCFPIAFLHLDCDWYFSVRTCLNELYKGVSSGGIIQVDDYLTWQGCKQAVDEFLASLGGKITLQRADRRSVWFQKP